MSIPNHESTPTTPIPIPATTITTTPSVLIKQDDTCTTTTTTKKSAAQIRRAIKRAEVRGETYIVPVVVRVVKKKENNNDQQQQEQEQLFGGLTSKLLFEQRIQAVQQYEKTMKELEDPTFCEDLKAKERRFMKRKAEAIAIENSNGCTSIPELLSWYTEHGKNDNQKKNNDDDEQKKKKNTKKLNEKEDGTTDKETTKNNNTTKKSIPYIAFFGQLSYETTTEDLFQHIQKEFAEIRLQQKKQVEAAEQENNTSTTTSTTIAPPPPTTSTVLLPPLSRDEIKIRLRTDPKTGKSLGMGFVEVSTPELLYGLLKLHHTYLQGRRMNVERTVGGKKHNNTKELKIQTLRSEQKTYMEQTVQSMLQEYYTRKEILNDSKELDEGVIALCTRHSATIVQAALERYVESNGRDMDNPSAYLSFLLGKLATEGIYHNRDENEATAADKKNHKKNNSNQSRGGSNNHNKNQNASTNTKRPRPSSSSTPSHIDNNKKSFDTRRNDDPNHHNMKRMKESSHFAQQGVDMNAVVEAANKRPPKSTSTTTSNHTSNNNATTKNNDSNNNNSNDTILLSKIFPSMTRGRGRGYM